MAKKQYAVELTVVDLDQRGSDAVPFGYLYFNDGTRTGYNLLNDIWHIFGGGQAWPVPTEDHYNTARAYLEANGAVSPVQSA